MIYLFTACEKDHLQFLWLLYHQLFLDNLWNELHNAVRHIIIHIKYCILEQVLFKTADLNWTANSTQSYSVYNTQLICIATRKKTNFCIDALLLSYLQLNERNVIPFLKHLRQTNLLFCVLSLAMVIDLNVVSFFLIKNTMSVHV